jgi:hypothetical protein
MKSSSVCLALLLLLIGCKSSPSQSTPESIKVAEQGSAAYLHSLSVNDRKSYDDLNAEWLKDQGSDPAAFKKYYASVVVESQTILGRLGYGTLFTGIVDDRTRNALLGYQKKNGIFQSGSVDPLTFYALDKDEKVLDESIVTTDWFIFNARSWNRYFSAEGAWDYKNKDEFIVQSDQIECDKSSGTCTDASASLVASSSLGVVTNSYRITKWDDYRILAELVDLPCEKDQIEIVRDEQTVTMHMISIDKDNPACNKLMGNPTTIDAHLVDWKKIGMPRIETLQKKRALLLQYSDSAKEIIQAGK